MLEDLPNEVFREILLCLSSVDLSKISLMSHYHNIITEPFLYRSISGWSGTQTWVTPLLRVILARPILGRHVHVLHLTWFSDDVIDPHSRDGALFSAAAERLGLSDRPWCEEAQALLLMLLLPNLQDLSIAASPLLFEFLEGMLTTPIAHPPFQFLRKFTPHRWVDDNSATITLLASIMRLPSILTIWVDMEIADEYRYEPAAEDSLIACHGQSKVTHLSFLYGNFSNFRLKEILQVPRALTHFTYHDTFELTIIETTTFQSALSHLRPTLQFLELGCLRTLEMSQSAERTIGSLRDWPVLRTVRCGLATLLGRPSEAKVRLVDVLPLGIRELKIQRREGEDFSPVYVEEWTVAEMTDQVVELVENRQLEQLTVNTGTWERRNHMRVNGYKAQVMVRLQAAYEIAGVAPPRIFVE